MKKLYLKITSFVLLFALVFCFSACGQKRTVSEIIEELSLTYGQYGDESSSRVKELIEELSDISPEDADKWSQIMVLWKAADNGSIKVNKEILPDGLSDSDELCLVALGFQLKPDGTMKDELLERLNVLLACAQKYPNALIVCTGGGTASENPDASEAGKMAEWLKEQGVDENRIIVEDKSLTTAQNAIYTYDILREKYPQVNQLAIISSDYHIATGTLFFGAECILRSGENGKEIDVVSNAAYMAPSGALSRMFQAGGLIELAGDVETAFEIYYETYDIHELPKLK